MVTGSGHTVWCCLSPSFPNLCRRRIEKGDIPGALPAAGGVGHLWRRVGCWHGTWTCARSKGPVLSVMLKAGWAHTSQLVPWGQKLGDRHTKLPILTPSQCRPAHWWKERGWAWRHCGIPECACMCPCHSMMLLPVFISGVHPAASPERWHSNYNCSRVSKELVEFFSYISRCT